MKRGKGVLLGGAILLCGNEGGEEDGGSGEEAHLEVWRFIFEGRSCKVVYFERDY